MHPLASALAVTSNIARNAASARDRTGDEWRRLHQRPDAPPCPAGTDTGAAPGGQVGTRRWRRLAGVPTSLIHLLAGIAGRHNVART